MQADALLRGGSIITPALTVSATSGAGGFWWTRHVAGADGLDELNDPSTRMIDVRGVAVAHGLVTHRG